MSRPQLEVAGRQMRRKREAQIVAMPTPERLRHAADFEESDARDRRHRVITILNPFPAAYRRGQFTERQHAAGEKFHVHYERGGLRGALASINFDISFG